MNLPLPPLYPATTPPPSLPPSFPTISIETDARFQETPANHSMTHHVFLFPLQPINFTATANTATTQSEPFPPIRSLMPLQPNPTCALSLNLTTNQKSK